MQFTLTHSTPVLPFGLERLFMSDDVGSGFENCRFIPLLLLFFHLQGTEIMSEFQVKTLTVGTTSALACRTSFRTICCQRLFLTAPRSSMSSLKGSGFVGSSFFFSGRTTVSKSGSGWALNCGTWKVHKKQEMVSQCSLILKFKETHSGSDPHLFISDLLKPLLLHCPPLSFPFFKGEWTYFHMVVIW